jgi:two-component system cell cycle sensor histidine kinase PleC
MHAGEVDLSEIVAGAVTRAAVAASAAKVTIENKTAKGEIAGWGDAQRIGQAVDHLLRTALHVSSGGGRILVRASVADGRWPEIAVRDYGAGFSRDEIRAALSAFDEVHRGLNRSFAGPGVGLAVAKTFVEMQGGIFEIKSKAGEGTIVRIMLPPAEAPSRAAAQENGAQPAGAVRKAS